MSRIRVLFGLRGAVVLARPRSWNLGDTSSIALSFMGFQIYVEGLANRAAGHRLTCLGSEFSFGTGSRGFSPPSFSGPWRHK